MGRIEYTVELDGLRGVAVLIVMFSHFHGLFGINPGALGVDIFFTLSGFLITRILLAELNDTGRIGFFNFYARRFLRLVPALVVMVAFACVFYVVWGSSASSIFHRAAPALFYYSNWVRAFELWSLHALGHTWSLAIEEQFYLLWPVILVAGARFIGAERLVWLCLALAAVVVLHRLNLLSEGASDARVTNGFDTRADPLLIGAALGAFASYRPVKHPWLAYAGMAGAAAILFMILYKPHYRQFGMTMTAVASACIIANCIGQADNIANRFLRNRFLVYTGTISYGLYLWHYPIVRFAWMNGEQGVPLTVRHTVALFVLVPLTYAICWASYRWIERPALAMKERFSTAGTAPQPDRIPA